ncbi:precorrin-3B synthase [Pseudomonas sp. PCH199]|uniref:precorrin-3B synthase n=1 Tax=unclassified Pseudomonas TaxID=196821 RepID=UPI000BC5C5E1|nr:MULTISPECIES: precorrin-3B synthase [unclassified Pseudomonas]MCW8276408.1 precorrin-3B synthase [Pseudomonas sp. PCH199]PAM83204.1 precorrin-3B synthase [Pseudomonas sp. ERMR1:02]
MNSRQKSNPLRPSACPGLLRIVQALDGGICRIKLNGGSIRAQQAVAVADAAERYAGGVIEATNRANLQIRGIGCEQATLINGLLAAGLGPSNAAGDDVRNLMLSPAAGIDRQMLFDTRPLAEQILATVQRNERFHDLSAKFAVQLDGGEALAMLEHPHDLWLSAFERDGERRLAFGLAGCPTDAAAGSVALDDGLGLVVAVLDLFLELARPEQTRMRHLLAEHSIEDFLHRLAERAAIQVATDWRRSPDSSVLHIGAHPQAEAGLVYVGAVPPLGRLNPAMLRGAAQLADEFGDGSLRFTPWQSLLLPNIRNEHGAEVIRRLELLGLLCSTDQPLTRMIACTGSNGCGKSLAETKGDARQLAALLQRHGHALSVHLSGCPRSCAAAHTAPATLLAVAPGHYDLYFRDAAQSGLGALHASNLTIEAVAALLDARSRSPLDA